jgi:hypothetical protein
MTKSIILAAALIGIVGVAQAKDKTAPAKKAATGECHGVNACKGKGDCGGKEGNSCKGTNSCKGKGWTTTTEKACKAKKGQWQASK